jgi:hypothetical protein
MYALDPIDTLLEIYSHPLTKEHAQPDFDEELIPLLAHLENFITTHLGTVTNRHQVRLITSAVVLRNQIAQYLKQPTTSTGRGE